MANLLSPGTAFAGLFSNAILSSTGAPVVSTPVTVYQSDGSTVATLYAGYDKTGGTATNPVDTDAYGNLVFYTDPGQYVLGFTVASTPVTVVCIVDPWFTDSAWNAIVDTAGLTAVSGDSILASAAGGAITETLPAPYLGARVRVTKTDDSGNAVTISTTGGAAIRAIDQSSGSTYVLVVQGNSAEVEANGTDWYVVNSTSGLMSVPFYGFGGALVGSPPPSGGPVLIQTGTGIATLDGGSQAAVTFPIAFPNGVAYCDCTPYISSGPPSAPFVINAGPATLSGFTFTGYFNGSLAPADVFQYQWMAAGF